MRMQNRVAILQSSGKSMEGFFMGRLRERVFFVLAKKYRAMEGGLAARRFSKKISDPGKNPRRDFFRAGHSTRDWRGGGSRSVGMEGVGAPGTPESP